MSHAGNGKFLYHLLAINVAPYLPRFATGFFCVRRQTVHAMNPLPLRHDRIGVGRHDGVVG